MKQPSVILVDALERAGLSVYTGQHITDFIVIDRETGMLYRWTPSAVHIKKTNQVSFCHYHAVDFETLHSAGYILSIMEFIGWKTGVMPDYLSEYDIQWSLKAFSMPVDGKKVTMVEV